MLTACSGPICADLALVGGPRGGWCSLAGDDGVIQMWLRARLTTAAHLSLDMVLT